MTDKELLELAAKAAGYRTHGWIGKKFYVCRINDPAENYDPFEWNPLTDDGDALRLAVKLMMEIRVYKNCVCAEADDGELVEEDIIDDPCAATRRVIVRAAAGIGRAK